MKKYVIIIIQTRKGRIWEVRRKGRLFWKTLGRFRKESEANDCIRTDMGGDGGITSYAFQDRRGFFNVWVLEYKNVSDGVFRKEREEFMTGLNARIHKWVYSLDKNNFDFKIYKENKGL